MSPPSQDQKPLPLSDTLRDLAVLRASDIDLSEFLLPEEAGDSNSKDPQSSGHDEQLRFVELSYDLVKEARAAIRILNRGDVDEQGTKIDDVRGGLEEIVNGLSTKQS